MSEDGSDPQGTIHDRLREAHVRSESSAPQPSPSFEDVEAEAAFWRAQFENERERLAKLWVAYKDLEAELEAREEETDEIAERKAAARLAEDGNPTPEPEGGEPAPEEEGEAIELPAEPEPTSEEADDVSGPGTQEAPETRETREPETEEIEAPDRDDA